MKGLKLAFLALLPLTLLAGCSHHGPYKASYLEKPNHVKQLTKQFQWCFIHEAQAHTRQGKAKIDNLKKCKSALRAYQVVAKKNRREVAHIYLQVQKNIKKMGLDKKSH